jgi:hypothetical protein
MIDERCYYINDDMLKLIIKAMTVALRTDAMEFTPLDRYRLSCLGEVLDDVVNDQTATRSITGFRM